MKKYLAFFGENYFPLGGMYDYIGAYSDLQDAIKEIETKAPNKPFGNDFWGHVYDIELGDIIWTLNGDK
jgi:hypothetical protein